ncbi:MAG: 3-deoxy-D-manno-octulosonic acid transferase [Nitrospinae bacterium]|nr:3-deoxy-D-manno-octulosonic acid transferase [Nitrospinota bacterium]
MGYFVYNALLYIALTAFSPVIAWYALTKPKYKEGFWKKLGFGLPARGAKTIWLHAVSVGEVMAAEPLIKALKEKTALPVTLSVTTATGREVAQKRLGSQVAVVHFPYDFPGAARRSVRAINPAAFVMVDTEIWPNVIRECKRSGAAVILANGRISDKSYPKYIRLKWFMREVLGIIDICLMQGEEDTARITAMGADAAKVKTIGNLKYDKPCEPVDAAQREQLRRSLGISPEEKVFFLGSVHEGEEDAIKAFLEVKKNVGALRLVIAPRRIENIGWIDRALDGSGLHAVRKTSLAPNPGHDPLIVPVIDTFGELAKLYAVADVAFAGGSLIPHGGQNPLEPAAHGVPVLFGPHMTNFKDAARSLLSADAAWTAQSESEIAERLSALLSDNTARLAAGEAALKAVEANRGAASRSAEIIAGLIK